MRPLFSCVIPVKGRRPFFERALESLRSQGMGDELEIIVQDGDVEPDRGQSDALNRGFAKAKGEWFFWLNADDVLLPGALKKVVEIVGVRSSNSRKEQLSPVWVVGNELFIDEKDRWVDCSVGCRWHDFLFRHAVPHVNGPSAFFRCELFDRVGGLDVSLEFCMDWDLWIRFAQAGARYVRIDDFLWAQRRWPGSKTQREIPAEELTQQQGEIRGMLAKNGFSVTRLGLALYRGWRLASGCYWKEWRWRREMA